MNKVVGLEPDSSYGPNDNEGTRMVYKNDIAKCSHALTDCETIVFPYHLVPYLQLWVQNFRRGREARKW